MSVETLRVRIEAVDAASATLERIGEAATALTATFARLESQGSRAMSTPAAPRDADTGDGGAAAGRTTMTLAVRDEATAPVAALGRMLGELDGSDATVRVTAEADAAREALGALAGEMAALRGAEATVAVRAETAGAQAALAATASQQRALDGTLATLNLRAETAGATAAMAATRAAHAALDGRVATLRIAADTSGAMAGIGWAAGYAGRVLATSYIDIVTRRSTIGIGPTARHGGVPGHAHGGVVLAEMHEAGPEVLHLPGGETAVTSGRGSYAVPAGTYVSPAPASAGLGGGGVTINLTVNGGGQEIAETVIDVFEHRILPDLAEELRRYRVANGGMW